MDIQKVQKGVSILEKYLSQISALSDATKNLIILLLLSLHLALSIYLKDLNWLSAFGGLITAIGLLLVFFQTSLIDHEKDFLDLHADKKPDCLIDGGVAMGDVVPEDKIGEKLTERRLHYIRKYQNLRYYFWLTVGGTLTWAYAGFFNFLFKN